MYEAHLYLLNEDISIFLYTSSISSFEATKRFCGSVCVYIYIYYLCVLRLESWSTPVLQKVPFPRRNASFQGRDVGIVPQ